MTRFRRFILPVALSMAVIGGAMALASSNAAADPPTPRLSAQERNLIRSATHRFRDVDVAVAEGYLPTDHCVAQPGSGMGYHYVHPEHINDGVVDPSKPDVLVYHDAPNGRLRLGAVEYLEWDADGDLDTDDDRPFLFGRHGFDGPMPGHEPGMPVHYDLHVWLYEHNPDGELTAWNPRVTCPNP